MSNAERRPAPKKAQGDELAQFKALAEQMSEENANLKKRLLAFEEGRSASDFPLDSNGWQYDGERYVLAVAGRSQPLVVCELSGSPETREQNAFLICQARSAIFWCEAHEQTALGLGKLLDERDARIKLLFAVVAELVRRITLVPPDILEILERLLERIGFHFKPDFETVQLVEETETIIAQIREATT